MAEEAKKSYSKFVIKVIIMIAIMVGISLIPPFGDVTEVGMTALGIFVGTVYGWCFLNDLGLASLISITALCLSGGVTAAEVFAGGIGNYIAVMTLVFLFITVAISQLGITDFVIQWLMNLKLAQGRPWIKFAMFMFSIFFVSVLAGANIACLMGVPLFYSLIERSGIEKKSVVCHAMLGGLALSAFLGEAALPFKQAPLLYFGIMQSSGVAFNPGDYIFAFPFFVFLLLVYIGICRFIFRLNVSKLRNLDDDTNEEKMSLDNRQKLLLITVGILMVLLCLVGFLTPNWGIIYTFFNRLGLAGLSLAFMVLMIVIRVDGKPLLDIPALAKDFPWAAYFMLANFMPMSNFLVSDAAGVKATIANNLGPILSNMSPVVMAVVIIVATVVFTNFLNNAVVFMLVISALCLLGGTIPDLNVVALSYLVGLSACLCYALPSGNMWMAYLFSFSDLIDVKKWSLMNAVSIIILCAVVVTLGYFYYSLVF